MYRGVLSSLRTQLPEITTISHKPISVPVFSDTQTSFLSAYKAVALTQTPALQAKPVTEKVSPSIAFDPKDFVLPGVRHTQYKNECGPTAMANALEVMKADYKNKYGVELKGLNLDNYHNWFGSDTVGHGPGPLAEMAKSLGAKAGVKLNVYQQNFADLTKIKQIDECLLGGAAVQVLGINGGGSNKSIQDYIKYADDAHWVTVVGRKVTAFSTSYYVMTGGSNTPQLWSSDNLSRFCNNNIMPGGHRFMQVVTVEGTFADKAVKASFSKGLPMTSSFKNTIDALHVLEDTFYSVEKSGHDAYAAADKAAKEIAKVMDHGIDAMRHAADSAVDALEDVWDDVADAAEDVWDSIFG